MGEPTTTDPLGEIAELAEQIADLEKRREELVRVARDDYRYSFRRIGDAAQVRGETVRRWYHALQE